MANFDNHQKELDRIMHEQNTRGLEELEWYSPLEMQSILYHPLSSDSPVQLRNMDEADYRRVPLLNQARYLMEKIRQSDEVKMTAKGFLPMELVKDVYSQGLMKEYFIDKYKKNKTLRELDSYTVHLTRLLLEVAGLTKKRKGKLSLTKKGEELINDPHGLLIHLLGAISFRFNLGYFDGYGQNNIGRLGWAFTVILLSKYGRTERPEFFYAEKHFNAFPAMVNEAESHFSHDQQITAYRCYSLRTFEHFLQHLGVINLIFERYFDEVRFISATDLLWQMFKVDIPNMAKGRN